MKYEEFKEELLKELRTYILLHEEHPEEYIIEDIGKCYKNNMEMDEFCVYRTWDSVGKCIYPEAEYEEYRNGRTLREIVKDWPGWRTEPPENYEKAVEEIEKGWEQMKEKIVLRLIHVDQNKHLLQRVPWRELEHTDLGIMYQIMIDADSGMAVTRLIAKMWNVTEEELYQTAYQNLQEEECVFSAGELIPGPEGLQLRETEPLKTEGFLYNPELWYAVYADRQFGAAAVLNRKIMKGAESFFGRKFFLFPLIRDRMMLIHEEDHRLLEKTIMYLRERQEEGVDVENDLSNSMYVWEEGKLSFLKGPK